MNTDKKISVVIPAYNAEPYISKCLKSILNQDYHNLEVIIVNDGSSDNTLNIITSFANNDNRIVIINQANAGHQKAREAGINIATGEYITFVDSDDSLPSQSVISKMYRAMTPECSLVVGRLNIDDGKRQRLFPSKTFETKSISEYLNNYLICGQVGWQIYSKLFRLDALKQVDTKPINITLGEDALFVLVYLDSVNGSVKMVNEALYNYYTNPNSITHKANQLYSLNIFALSDFIEVKFKDKIDIKGIIAFRLIGILTSFKYGWLGVKHPDIAKTIKMYNQKKSSLSLITTKKRFLILALIHWGDYINKLKRKF